MSAASGVMRCDADCAGARARAVYRPARAAYPSRRPARCARAQRAAASDARGAPRSRVPRVPPTAGRMCTAQMLAPVQSIDLHELRARRDGQRGALGLVGVAAGVGVARPIAGLCGLQALRGRRSHRPAQLALKLSAGSGHL